mgnify:CR=1 FL=1
MVAEFQDLCKLDGEIVPVTPYNEKQASHSAEVTAAMAGSPQLICQLSRRRRYHQRA